MSKINTKTSEEKAHSEFGGSQAERILNCPASVKLSRGIPNKENPASRRGTAAHACLEFFVLNRLQLKSRTTRKKVLAIAQISFTKFDDGEKIRWDEDMIAHALDALAWVEDQLGPGDEVHAETHLDSSKFTTKDQASTLDISVVKWRSRELLIADYKYGKHPVKVVRNAQLIYYAVALLIKLKAWGKIDRIRCVIIQPWAYKEPQEWYISVDDAVKWARKFKKTVKIALGPNPPFKYGDKWCFFCPAKTKCPEVKKKLLSKDFP